MKYPLMQNNIMPEDLQGVIELLQEKDPKLTSGPSVHEFEQVWSKWLDVKYSVFVNSGASSNLLALAWLKSHYPDGGRVILPPFTWSSDISSVYWMGFEPEFVDIKLSTLAIDEDLLEEVVEKHDDIRAVFLTHAQGINGLTPKIIELCKAHNIHLIEDVCESHGVKLHDGRKAGTEGVISCFSFYYAHHMSTIEGGMLCTNDPEVYQYLRMIRSHGMLREATDQNVRARFEQQYPDLNPLFIFTAPGFNVRNNEIGALIGLSQIKRLDKMIEKRIHNFNYFLKGLPNWAFKDFNLEGQSNYAFNLILNDPDDDLMGRLEASLHQNSIEYRRGSAGGGNQLRQPYVKSLVKFKDVIPELVTPVTDHVHFYGMYIGNYPELPQSDIDWLLEVICSV